MVFQKSFAICLLNNPGFLAFPVCEVLPSLYLNEENLPDTVVAGFPHENTIFTFRVSYNYEL